MKKKIIVIAVVIFLGWLLFTIGHYQGYVEGQKDSLYQGKTSQWWASQEKTAASSLTANFYYKQSIQNLTDLTAWADCFHKNTTAIHLDNLSAYYDLSQSTNIDPLNQYVSYNAVKYCNELLFK